MFYKGENSIEFYWEGKANHTTGLQIFHVLCVTQLVMQSIVHAHMMDTRKLVYITCATTLMCTVKSNIIYTEMGNSKVTKVHRTPPPLKKT